jgi:peptide/nickel transport system substrate-binding protein
MGRIRIFRQTLSLSIYEPMPAGQGGFVMERRQFLSGMAALAAPAISTAAESRVLRYVTSAGVVQLDPLSTTIYPTLILGLQIFESLYSVDEYLRPSPQMAAGHSIEDDGKRWVIRLRDGLRFHDGEPVLARDCVASINRWMKRDSCGRTLALRLDAVEAPDDRTVVFRLKQQFPQLPFVLGKLSPNLLAVMPGRLAATDPNQQLTELVGSGPFRFVAGEFSANSFTALARFQAYLPRDELPNGASGGRVAKIDRVDDVIYIPLGRYALPSAWRPNISGILEMNMPIMWNISKS